MFSDVLADVAAESEGGAPPMERLLHLEMEAQIHEHYNRPSPKLRALVRQCLYECSQLLGHMGGGAPLPLAWCVDEECQV